MCVRAKALRCMLLQRGSPRRAHRSAQSTDCGRASVRVQMTDLPSDTVRELLVSLARLRPNLGWELKLPTDDEFIARNPELVQRQRAVFEQRYAVYGPSARVAEAVTQATLIAGVGPRRRGRTGRHPELLRASTSSRPGRRRRRQRRPRVRPRSQRPTGSHRERPPRKPWRRTPTATRSPQSLQRDLGRSCQPGRRQPPNWITTCSRCCGSTAFAPSRSWPRASKSEHWRQVCARSFPSGALIVLRLRLVSVVAVRCDRACRGAFGRARRCQRADLPHNLLADDAVPTAAQVEGSVVRVGQLFTADAYVPSTVEGAPQQKVRCGGAAAEPRGDWSHFGGEVGS